LTPVQAPSAARPLAQEPARPGPETPTATVELVAAPLSLELGQLQEAWHRSVLPAVQERKIWLGSLLAEATPIALDGTALMLEFPPEAGFHRNQLLDDPTNVADVSDALFEVTGQRLTISTVVAETSAKPTDDEERLDEDAFIALLKDTLEAEEIESPDRPTPR
jgi:hypothetical protein